MSLRNGCEEETCVCCATEPTGTCRVREREMNINGTMEEARAYSLWRVSSRSTYTQSAADTFDCHTIMLDNELLSARVWQLNKLVHEQPGAELLFFSLSLLIWKKVLVYSF
jgi:hypothetical protein